MADVRNPKAADNLEKQIRMNQAKIEGIKEFMHKAQLYKCYTEDVQKNCEDKIKLYEDEIDRLYNKLTELGFPNRMFWNRA